MASFKKVLEDEIRLHGGKMNCCNDFTCCDCRLNLDPGSIGGNVLSKKLQLHFYCFNCFSKRIDLIIAERKLSEQEEGFILTNKGLLEHQPKLKASEYLVKETASFCKLPPYEFVNGRIDALIKFLDERLG